MLSAIRYNRLCVQIARQNCLLQNSVFYSSSCNTNQKCRTKMFHSKSNSNSRKLDALPFSTNASASTSTAKKSSSGDDMETYEFHAETRQLLDIVAKSLYSDKEVFIRELIANASDALEKRRLKALQIGEGGSATKLEFVGATETTTPTSSTTTEEAAQPGIRISVDSERGTLTIEDSGVGMTRREVVQNIGTIARSGTGAFRKTEDEGASSATNTGGMEDPGKSTAMIGQFGVGFYSAFMVSKKVELWTKKYDGGASTGAGGAGGTYWVCRIAQQQQEGASGGASAPTYQVSDWTAAAPQTGQDGSDVILANGGTRIRLTLRDDEIRRFTDATALKQLIRKHCRFVNFSIRLNGEELERPDPIWLREPSALTEHDYLEFYRDQTANDAATPMFNETGGTGKPRYIVHYKAEAPIEIRAVMFCPEADQYDPMRGASGNNESGTANTGPDTVSLYCRNVLVAKHAGPLLLDKWLRFWRGVVSSDDLPLNLSRELLQDSHLVARIRRTLSSRLLAHLISRAYADPDAYDQFYRQMGALYIKEAIVTSAGGDLLERERIAKLLRFQSSKLPAGQLTSLEAYTERMRPGAREIYFLAAPNRHLALNNVYLQRFRQTRRQRPAKEQQPEQENAAAEEDEEEVLLLVEPHDEVVMMQLGRFDGKTLKSVETEAMQTSSEEDSLSDDKQQEKTGEQSETGAAGEHNTTGQMTTSDRERMKQWAIDYLKEKRGIGRVTLTRSGGGGSESGTAKLAPSLLVVKELGAVRHFIKTSSLLRAAAPQKAMASSGGGATSESGAAVADPLQQMISVMDAELQLNADHSLVRDLHQLLVSASGGGESANPQRMQLAELVLDQLCDAALAQAGLVEDAAAMVSRMNELTERLLANAIANK